MEDMTDIEMFDVRNQMGAKMDRIKSLASQADANMSQESDKCTELLSELHTACGEESCADPNMDSFQLSVDRVCAAVNTQTKLKVETIGNFYDFQRFTVQVWDDLVDETPLSELRPVRCCRDDDPVGEEELWYKPRFRNTSCKNTYALAQRWTGEESPERLYSVAPKGYTRYQTQECKDDNEFIEVDGEIFKDLEWQECADLCDGMSDCVSFERLHSDGALFIYHKWKVVAFVILFPPHINTFVSLSS